jgi:hypothetical protein
MNPSTEHTITITQIHCHPASPRIAPRGVKGFMARALFFRDPVARAGRPAIRRAEFRPPIGRRPPARH